MHLSLFYNWHLAFKMFGASIFNFSFTTRIAEKGMQSNGHSLSITVLSCIFCSINFEQVIFWFSYSLKQSGKVHGNPWPPYKKRTHLHPSYKGLMRLLHCKTLHIVLFTLLYKVLLSCWTREGEPRDTKLLQTWHNFGLWRIFAVGTILKQWNKIKNLSQVIPWSIFKTCFSKGKRNVTEYILRLLLRENSATKPSCFAPVLKRSAHFLSYTGSS